MNRKIMLLIALIGILALSHACAADLVTDDSNATAVQQVDDLSLDEETSEVSESGNVYNITPDDDIQKTIDDAEAGDTISLSGNFVIKDSIHVNKSLSIIGSGALIQRNSMNDAQTFFIIEPDASGVVLANLRFYSAHPNGAVLWKGNGGCIMNCEFYKNDISGERDGGALVLMGSDCNVTNCTFEENHASQNGGAISLEGSRCLISDCSFERNYASKRGGAIFIIGDDNVITGCNFTGNYVSSPMDGNVTTGGGAIYASATLTVDGCRFDSNRANGSCGGAIYMDYHGIIQNSYFNANSALKGNDIAASPNIAQFVQIRRNSITLDYKENVSQSVYGIDESRLVGDDNTFIHTKRDSKVNFVSGMVFDYGSSGTVSVIVDGGKIESSNIRVLNHPEAKISFANNVLTVSNLAVGKYTLRVTTTPDADHNAVDSDLSVTVNRARASIKATKTTVALKKSGKFSVTLVDSKTGKGIANMKVTLKVYTGKKCKTVTLRTNSKGVANYQTKKLAKGSHKVIISAKHSGYDFYPVTTSIKVVKQKAIKFKVNRKTAKDGASLSITVLDKKTKKHLNGVKVKLLIYSGSKLVRTEILKTLTKYGKKGIVGYATNELSVGNHKVKIVAGDIRYTGSSKSGLKILKSAKGYPKVTTRVSAKL